MLPSLKEERQSFPPQDVYDIVRMMSEDSAVIGAYTRLTQQMCLSQMEIKYNGGNLGPSMDQIRSEYWLKFTEDLNKWTFFFDFCLYAEIKKKVALTPDELRSDLYGEAVEGEKEVEIIVPLALTYDFAYRAVKRRRHKFEVDIIVMDDKGQDIDYDVKVVMNGTPDWCTGRFTSIAASYLATWRYLQGHISRDNYVSNHNANPPTFLEEKVASQMQPLNFLDMQKDQMLYNVSMKGGALYGTNRPENMPTITKGMSTKTYNDMNTEHPPEREDMVYYITPGHTMVSNPVMPVYRGDIHKYIELADMRLSLVTSVPISFIRPVSNSQKGGAKLDTESLSILKDQVSLISQSRARMIRHVWCSVYKNVKLLLLVVNIPSPTNLDFEAIRLLVGDGYIDDDLAREEAYKHHGIDEDRVKKYKLPALKKQKYEEP